MCVQSECVERGRSTYALPTMISKARKTTITINPKEKIMLEQAHDGAASLVSTLDHGRKGTRQDAAFDGMESLLLSMYGAGIPFGKRMRDSIKETIDAIYNHFGA